jgi:hypothetical protein
MTKSIPVTCLVVTSVVGNMFGYLKYSACIAIRSVMKVLLSRAVYLFSELYLPMLLFLDMTLRKIIQP